MRHPEEGVWTSPVVDLIGLAGDGKIRARVRKGGEGQQGGTEGMITAPGP